MLLLVIVYLANKFLSLSLSLSWKALTKCHNYIKVTKRCSLICNCDIELTSRNFLADLYWLNVLERVKFKLVSMVHNCLQHKDPRYLKLMD